MKTALSLILPVLTSLPLALAANEPMVPSYALCAACHGPDGKGINAGTPTPMAPSLYSSALINAGDGEILASIIATGIAREDQKYLGMMAPLGAAMSAEAMAEVINYLRSNFDNEAPPVTAEQAAEWKTKYSGQPPQTRADLETKVTEASD